MVFLSTKNFNIITGIIIIILSILLLVYSTAAMVSILIIVAIIMMFIGITQLLNTKSEANLERRELIINYLIGIFELIIGITLIISISIDPISTAVFSIRLLGVIILFIGLRMLYLGYTNNDYTKEFRYILMIIGCIIIIFSIVILIIPSVGFTLVAISIAIPLLFNGVNRLVNGFLS